MNWLQNNLQKIVYFAFLVPIITVAFVSISHVTTWYGLTNTNKWALYLSFGVEIAALASLAAISVSMGRKVYLPFGIVTLIQLVGNVFYSYSYIDENSKMFKDWVELSNVFFQYLIEEGDIVGHKRILALFSGGLLPIISLSFLHLLVKLQESDLEKGQVETLDNVDIEELSKKAGMFEYENTKNTLKPTDEDLSKLEEYLDNLSKIKFSEPEKEDLKLKRKRKPRVTPTEVEYTTTPDDDIDDENFPTPTPKVRKARVKKLDINFDEDLESTLKKLTYRKRDDRDN
jgi:hypothetical protein